MTQKISLSGFARVQIAENGEIVGDSGWVKNLITDYGLDECLGQVLVGGGASKRISAIALGEGSAPATDDGTVTLDQEIVATNAGAKRQAYSGSIVTAANGSGVTARYIATFGSGDRAATYDISNIGLYSNTSGTGLMAGTTYASTKVNTNQDVHVTYEWQFLTA